MDKLQWFKFSYADWRMGKIQRCSEVTQARFINLCCLYWSKNGIISYEDAEIEVDEEHLNTLIRKKVISSNDGFINISFLDEQLSEVEEKVKDKSRNGKIGNLKRWHLDIYKRYENKEITYDEAINLSHTNRIPIANQSQNIAEKNREDKIRVEEKRRENKIVYDNSTITLTKKCLEHFPEHLRPKSAKDKNKVLDTMDKLIRLDGLTPELIIPIVEWARNDEFWKGQFMSLNKLRKKNKDGIKYIVYFNEQLKMKSNGGTKQGYNNPEELAAAAERIAANLGYNNSTGN